VFYVVAIALSPAVVSGLGPAHLNFERWYTVNAMFLLLLAARALGALWARGRTGAALAAALVCLFVLGNAPRIGRLLREQRGTYEAALRSIIAAAPDGRITMSFDHPFRNPMVIAYHASRDPDFARFVPLRANSWQGVGPDWYFQHRFEGQPAPPASFEDHAGNRYELVREYPSAPLSGFRWYLFRRAEPQTSDGTP
jgi:hypothetical protein